MKQSVVAYGLFTSVCIVALASCEKENRYWETLYGVEHFLQLQLDSTRWACSDPPEYTDAFVSFLVDGQAHCSPRASDPSSYVNIGTYNRTVTTSPQVTVGEGASDGENGGWGIFVNFEGPGSWPRDRDERIQEYELRKLKPTIKLKTPAYPKDVSYADIVRRSFNKDTFFISEYRTPGTGRFAVVHYWGVTPDLVRDPRFYAAYEYRHAYSPTYRRGQELSYLLIDSYEERPLAGTGIGVEVTLSFAFPLGTLAYHDEEYVWREHYFGELTEGKMELFFVIDP